MVHRYLSDSSHRETYESAHSVVLSIFASHAQQHQPGHLLKRGLPGKFNDRQIVKSAEYESRHSQGPGGEFTKNGISIAANPDSISFVHRMVPYYAQCLIQVSSPFSLPCPHVTIISGFVERFASLFITNPYQHALRDNAFYADHKLPLSLHVL